MPATLTPPVPVNATRNPSAPFVETRDIYEPYEEGAFLVYEDVPVWCEHFSKQVNVQFGRTELRRVMDRCNERIRETGDYPPIAIGHTADDGTKKPEVVGFAGPFKLGMIGQNKPKTAILARMRFFKADAEKIIRYPRVSVEYWFKKDDPTGGYFDPISLLGADTPELDLGLRYGRQRAASELFCIRYSATHHLAQYAKAAVTFQPMTRRQVNPAGDTSGRQWTTPPRATPANTGLQGDPSKIVRENLDKYDARPAYVANRPQYNAGEISLGATALAQLVEALRPVVRELVLEAFPNHANEPPAALKREAAEGAVEQERNAQQRLATFNAAQPPELTSMYSKQAVAIVHSARERGEKDAGYEQVLKSLVHRHLANDDSEEFQRIRHAAEEDAERQKTRDGIRELAGRVRKLETTGPAGEKRAKYAQEAAGLVHRARADGEVMEYRDALAKVYRSHGETMPR